MSSRARGSWRAEPHHGRHSAVPIAPYDRDDGSPHSMSRRGLLITAEGLDRSGTGRLLELLARWLERRGRTVEIVPPASSRSVRRAAAPRPPRGIPAARAAPPPTAAVFHARAGVAPRRHLRAGA